MKQKQKIWINFDILIREVFVLGYNRGYGFVTYCDKETAKEAVKKLNRYEIKPNRRMIVKLSVQFNRLYVGGIPKPKSKDEIFNAFSKEVDNLKG